MEDIFSKLITDHNEVKEFLSKLEKDPTNKEIFHQLEREIWLHDEAEEEAFYGPLRKKINKLDIIIDVSEKEHHLVSDIISYINDNDPNDKESAILISFLKKSLEGHILKEENDVFPLAKEVFSVEEIDEITELFDQRKAQLKENL